MMRNLNAIAMAAIAAILIVATPSANAFAGEASTARVASKIASISSQKPASMTNAFITHGKSSARNRSSGIYRKMAEDAGDAATDPNEIVGRRIIVTGDVQGGYFRSCVANEAGRFRRLQGTMTPPDETRQAEIYVEGKRKMVDGFVRWCKKGDVGLSQKVSVQDVFEEVPTGLYDSFSVDTGRKQTS